MKNLVVIFLVSASIQLAFSAQASWKLRAREHFDVHTITSGDQDFKYKGLSNTFNFWYEKPFEYAIGLAYNPVLGSAKSEDDPAPTGIGEEIHLILLGIEGKYFPIKDLALFLRGGIYGAELDVTGSDLRGWSGYGGIGWEFKVGGIGIATEVAYRYTDLEEDVTVKTLTPSIGFHLYNMF